MVDRSAVKTGATLNWGILSGVRVRAGPKESGSLSRRSRTSCAYFSFMYSRKRRSNSISSMPIRSCSTWLVSSRVWNSRSMSPTLREPYWVARNSMAEEPSSYASVI